MSRWPGKYVIGLTGNIATGKSVVRKMMEHLGAFGIDADALSHQAMAKGGPAFTPIVKSFGEWLLTPEGEINRNSLAKVVFTDPPALAKLEAIVHPFVGQAVDIFIKRSQSPVVVIEAIKLMEGALAKDCDAIWVVNVPEEMQIARLVEKRTMSAGEARQRVVSQNSQLDKLKAAHVIIENNGSFEETWTQVQIAFSKISAPAAAPTPSATPQPTASASATPAASASPAKPQTGKLAPDVKGIKVRRGTPKDAALIAELMKAATNGQRSLSRGDVIAAFGDKAFYLADYDGKLSALVGWKVENLVARVDEVYFLANAPLTHILPPLIEAVEKSAQELQSEAALVFIPLAIAQQIAPMLAGPGYIPQTTDKLGVAAWKDAAKESQPPNTGMFFKKLREDRVLRPV